MLLVVRVVPRIPDILSIVVHYVQMGPLKAIIDQKPYDMYFVYYNHPSPSYDPYSACLILLNNH